MELLSSEIKWQRISESIWYRCEVVDMVQRLHSQLSVCDLVTIAMGRLTETIDLHKADIEWACIMARLAQDMLQSRIVNDVVRIFQSWRSIVYE